MNCTQSDNLQIGLSHIFSEKAIEAIRQLTCKHEYKHLRYVGIDCPYWCDNCRQEVSIEEAEARLWEHHDEQLKEEYFTNKAQQDSN